ncbi:MFS transporter [Nonomuraea sp. NPDC049646]|uniref:MFS transporter n=1 Tax=unclassified Nonomuraea TaxID=2593643 RepID=UPI0037B9A499
MLRRYMIGVVAARTGDEMSGPALLVAGLAATGSPLLGASLLAGLTVSAAVGGPLLGVLLDRARRPGRLLACCLLGYASGLLLVAAGVGRVPGPALVALAVVTGLAGPALTGGWTGQLPLVSGPDQGRLARATALDAMTYNIAGLAGPAAVGVIAAAAGGTAAVLISVALLLIALPTAWTLPTRHPHNKPTHNQPHPLPTPTHPTSDRPARNRPIGHDLPTGDEQIGEPGRFGRFASPVRAAGAVAREMAAGVRAVLGNRVLGRATVGSMVSCAGAGMFVVSAPVLGLELTGDSSRGTLLLAVTAAAGLAANGLLAWRGGPRRRNRTPAWDTTLAWSTALVGAGMALAAMAATATTGTAVAGTALAETAVTANAPAETPPAETAPAGTALARDPAGTTPTQTTSAGTGLAGTALVGTAAAYWIAVVAAGLVGVGEGPQLTALFAVRQREAPAKLRSQVFTTGASLKITSFAVGSALAGPLSAHSAAAALLTGAALQAVAVCILRRRRSQQA